MISCDTAEYEKPKKNREGQNLETYSSNQCSTTIPQEFKGASSYEIIMIYKMKQELHGLLQACNAYHVMN